MQIPLEITFRHMNPSPAAEARIRTKAECLERFHERIISCRVVVEAPHTHHHQGKLYHVRVDLKVPGREMAVSQVKHDRHAHEDLYVAVRDAFDAAVRQLERKRQRDQRKVKRHDVPEHGRVVELIPERDFGLIETPDGREFYFHRNSVLGTGYDDLTVGSEVRMAVELGEDGPQASSVHPVGKHHPVG